MGRGQKLSMLDLFSGIGGFTLAAERTGGFETVAFSEIERVPSLVLKCRFPEIPNLGDVREINGKEILERFGGVDVISGGFPCQDLSLAGRRAGLAGSRSGLFWEIARLAEEVRPRWLLLENVPGLLSIHGGRDFGIVLEALGELGYGVAWRVLDAQNFGVPQRRRRVFIVGHLGGPCPPEVLFEPEGVRGDTPAREKSGQEVAGALGGGSRSRGRTGDTDRMTSVLQVAHTLGDEGFDASEDGTGRMTLVPQVAHILTGSHRIDNESETFIPVAFNWQASGADWIAPTEDRTSALHAGQIPALAFAQNRRGEVRVSEKSTSLSSGGSSRDCLAFHIGVRRLTPTECERLQGFPDGWTDVPDERGRPAADGPRYRALGNAVCVPVVEWILNRLFIVHSERFGGGRA